MGTHEEQESLHSGFAVHAKEAGQFLAVQVADVVGHCHHAPSYSCICKKTSVKAIVVQSLCTTYFLILSITIITTNRSRAPKTVPRIIANQLDGDEGREIKCVRLAV